MYRFTRGLSNLCPTRNCRYQYAFFGYFTPWSGEKKGGRRTREGRVERRKRDGEGRKEESEGGEVKAEGQRGR